MCKLHTDIIFLSTIILLLCSSTSCSDNKVRTDYTFNQGNKTLTDTANADKYIAVYKFDSTYTDSSKVGEFWYIGDSLVKKSGEFNSVMPFESEFISGYVIDSALGKPVYITFDSTMCEVGGTSAWNKYLFTYDGNKSPVEIKHYKAWWNEGLGEAKRPAKPIYFLGETIMLEYRDRTIIQKAYFDDGKLIEMISKTYDDKKRLLSESWDAWSEYRYRVYYRYY